jgi:hypothetical protein
MPIIKLISFGTIRKDDWLIKISTTLDQILVCAYHRTTYQGQIRLFKNELEAVMFVEYLLLNGVDPADFTK